MRAQAPAPRRRGQQCIYAKGQVQPKQKACRGCLRTGHAPPRSSTRGVRHRFSEERLRARGHLRMLHNPGRRPAGPVLSAEARANGRPGGSHPRRRSGRNAKCAGAGVHPGRRSSVRLLHSRDRGPGFVDVAPGLHRRPRSCRARTRGSSLPLHGLRANCRRYSNCWRRLEKRRKPAEHGTSPALLFRRRLRIESQPGVRKRQARKWQRQEKWFWNRRLTLALSWFRASIG